VVNCQEGESNHHRRFLNDLTGKAGVPPEILRSEDSMLRDTRINHFFIVELAKPF